MKHGRSWASPLALLALTALAFGVMGYHPGLEDDGIYRAAILARLHPALFPYNADFFRLQMQGTIFPGVLAHGVAWTGLPLAWAELLGQLACLFGTLWASLRIARRLFARPCAQWAGVTLLAGLLTLPVTGTALYLMDQHLHPRSVATLLILLAVDRILAGRLMPAAPLLLAAFLFHPLMAGFGLSFCAFLALALHEPAHAWMRQRKAAALFPVWVFEPPNAAWRKALDTRTYYYLYKWSWYEWLGALGPIVLFALLGRWAERNGRTRLARFALAVFLYSLVQQLLAMLLLAPSWLVRVTPLQPMRYLHLTYLFLVLAGGCLLGEFVLKTKAWRWAVLLIAVNGAMLVWQRAEFSGSAHLELPGRPTANPWLQAFAWIRTHTPENAYFALDPHYLEAPGEDYHGFRALAERSQLADAVKDAAVVTQIPELGPVWEQQVEAQHGWRDFQLADFRRLKNAFGVDWVVVGYPQVPGLDCRWHNAFLTVCQIP